MLGLATAVSLLVLAAPQDLSLQVPAPLPDHPLRCVYQGVYPGAGAQTTWTLTTQGGDTWTTLFEDATPLAGILAPRLGGQPLIREAPSALSDQAADNPTAGTPKPTGLRVLEWSLTRQDLGSGPLQRSFDRLSVVLSGPAGAHSTVKTTVETEQVCKGTPRAMVVGDRWECQVKTRDSWTVSAGAIPASSGTHRMAHTARFRVLRIEPIATPSGATVDAFVIRRQEEGAPDVWRWTDPKQPWCPLKVERRRLDHVVGTDRLVALDAGPAQPQPPAKVEPQGGLGKMGLVIVIGIILALLLGAVMGWVGGWRQRRRGD